MSDNMVEVTSHEQSLLYILLEDICEVNDYSPELMGKTGPGVFMVREIRPNEINGYSVQLKKMSQYERYQFAKDTDNADLIEQYHLQDLSLWCADFEHCWEFTKGL